jgi:hypothetical protein
MYIRHKPYAQYRSELEKRKIQDITRTEQIRLEPETTERGEGLIERSEVKEQWNEPGVLEGTVARLNDKRMSSTAGRNRQSPFTPTS